MEVKQSISSTGDRMKLSPAREGWPLLNGLPLLHRGKVRDTYQLPEGNLLIVTTDGVSVFDFVLDALVHWKGTVLNCLTHWWLTQMPSLNVATHFVAAGADIDSYLPEPLRGDSSLQARAMIVHAVDVFPFEFVARAHLTGSALRDYRNSGGAVAGRQLPPGLLDGDLLPCIIDTPTTKSDTGHDESVDTGDIRHRFGTACLQLRDVFEYARGIARARGIVLVDTKLEFGSLGGVTTLADEVLTPDSSRFWDLREWEEQQRQTVRRATTPLDKELVRLWAKEHDVNNHDPSNADHVAFVHGLRVPAHVLEHATATYRYLFWRLTGVMIEDYLSDDLHIVRFATERPRRRLAVLLGSESDRGVIDDALAITEERHQHALRRRDLHIVSCHRNPSDLRTFVEKHGNDYDAIIACGGKAFALPGVLDALLADRGVNVPVIGVALGSPGSRSLLAAQLSISELPGTPVVTDELTGEPYTGIDGFLEAYDRVANGELPPPKQRATKPAQFFVS